MALLIKAGADTHKATTDDGTTPLYFSCSSGHNSIVKLLLKHGADVNLPGTKGYRPINIVCTNGHEPCLSTLLAYNADVSPHNGEDLIEVATSGRTSCEGVMSNSPRD